MVMDLRRLGWWRGVLKVVETAKQRRRVMASSKGLLGAHIRRETMSETLAWSFIWAEHTIAAPESGPGLEDGQIGFMEGMNRI